MYFLKIIDVYLCTETFKKGVSRSVMHFPVILVLKKYIICYKMTLFNFLWVFITVSHTYNQKKDYVKTKRYLLYDCVCKTHIMTHTSMNKFVIFFKHQRELLSNISDYERRP